MAENISWNEHFSISFNTARVSLYRANIDLPDIFEALILALSMTVFSGSRSAVIAGVAEKICSSNRCDRRNRPWWAGLSELLRPDKLHMIFSLSSMMMACRRIGKLMLLFSFSNFSSTFTKQTIGNYSSCAFNWKTAYFFTVKLEVAWDAYYEMHTYLLSAM